MADQVYKLAGTKLPALRADWFVATASRPPLYHTLLQLPLLASDLERLLHVDVQDDFLNDKLARAGFTASGVSRHNRLLERHEAAHGACWRSYDFKSSDDLSSLITYPLGPRSHDNPFNDQAFVHAGGEIIFHLPNGLQGYMLVNARDERINEGPTEIVRDKTETSGSGAIVNGLSCMACHQHGMIKDFKDTIRDGSALGGKPREKVRQLYVKAEEMNRLLQEDEDRFLRALDRATGLFLKIGKDQDKDIRDFPEVIGPLARQYLLWEVSAEQAAFELGLKEGRTLRAAILANESLRDLGLLPLARGNTIKREVWESVRGLPSPFQEAARILELGTPKIYH